MRFQRAEERLGIKEDFPEELTLDLNLKARIYQIEKAKEEMSHKRKSV